MDNVYSQRVEALRGIMRSKGWDAVIITGSDPHSSEYPAPRWKQVEWISGFTGEAGDIVVTEDHAGLWTDTRYFIQAEQQLAGTGIVLHKTRVPDQVLIPKWLSEVAFARDESVCIAVDGLCQRVSVIEEIREAFGDTEINIVSIPDMLDGLWKDRPAIPDTPIFELSDEEVGESSDSKIDWLREWFQAKGCDAMLVTALDEIAWLLNNRASDIDFNPLVISYLLVTTDDVKWFVRDNYCDIFLAVSEFEGKIFVDPGTLNYHLYSLMNRNMLTMGDSPIPLRKSVKNVTEVEGMKRAHVLDGIAMECFLHWLENEVSNGKAISEWDASQKLDSFRADLEGFTGNSFETISAYGKGAALPHYITPKSENAPLLQPRGLYLCDSGGQYIFGTTDITRTVPLGPCTRLEMEDYTLVLKCHIGLETAVFPKGTAGCQLDVLAREPLWKFKRNFGHGTGHGVGFFLGVHEGPQEFRQNFNRQALLPGMITTDEPGIYREGLHGVRHENVLLCKEAGTSEFGDWLEFEPLTLCHFDTSAIIKEWLTEEEKQWLNAYNAKVYETLSPLLPEDVSLWLKTKIIPI